MNKYNVSYPKTWSNFHKNYYEPIQANFDLWNEDKDTGSIIDRYNDTSEQLGKFIKSAINQNKTIRAYGSKWSLSRVPYTNGWMINTKPLNLHVTFKKSQILGQSNKKVDNLVFAQCGMSIEELNRPLKSKEKSLSTMGASNGQTIAGAVSTGTHGSAFKFGSIQDQVVGLHLIVGENQSYYLERQSDPVLRKSFANSINADLIRDDDFFNAALVSFGSFGFVHGLLLEVEDIFHLASNQGPFPTNRLKKGMWGLDFSGFSPFPIGDPYHVKFIINPYKKEVSYVQAMSKRKYKEQETYLPDRNKKSGTPKPTPKTFEPGNDIPHFMSVLDDVLAPAIPKLVTELTTDIYKPNNPNNPEVVGTIGEIFKRTTTRQAKVFSAAIGIELINTQKVLRVIDMVIKNKGNVAAVFSLRYVRKSQALLALSQFETTCIVELDGIQSRRTRNWLNHFFKTLRKEKIPFTQHWGKGNNFSTAPSYIRYCYGENIDTWLHVRKKHINESSRIVFNSEFIKRCKLDNIYA